MRIILQTHHDTRAEKWGLVHISLISGPGSQLWRWPGRWLAGALGRRSKKFPRPGNHFRFWAGSGRPTLMFPQFGTHVYEDCSPFTVESGNFSGLAGWRSMAFVRVKVLKECDAGRRKSSQAGEKARPASHASNPTLRVVEVGARQVVAPLSVYGAVETTLRHLNSRGHRVTFVLFSRDPRSHRGLKGVRRWSPKIARGQRE